ncbi:hypothetical protein ACEPAG_8674 [Sanghuangporus baumii]
MSARTFTVFQDASPVKKRPSARPLGRSVSAAAVLTSSARRSENMNTVSLPEKENLHPVTGLSLGAASSSGKKRKASESSTVLAPKVLGVPSGASGSAKAKPKRTDLKRKASTQAGSGKAKLKKESSKKDGNERKALSAVQTTSSSSDSTSTRRPVSRAGSRSVSALVLATIEEEPATQTVEEDASEAKVEEVTQAQIDSRCYELTVSPLADVSDAYIQSSETETKEEMKDEKLSFDKAIKDELDFSAHIREFFLFDDSAFDSESSTGSVPSLPTPPFSVADELDIFKTFDFDDLVTKDDAPKSAPVTPKKSQRLIRSLSLPTTPTKVTSKETDDASPSITPLTLPSPKNKDLNATFTFTTPKDSSSPTCTL